jgi:hypothetical protein
MGMEAFAQALTVAVFFGFVAFVLWLRQQRRVMIHRERLVAIEKGVDLSPVSQEVKRSSWNVQRLLLLAGLVWISVGMGFYMVFSEMLRHPTEFTRDVPPGIQYVGYGLIGVGISHLVAFAAGLLYKES